MGCYADPYITHFFALATAKIKLFTKKALSLILRNRALDDQTIIPLGYSCSKNRYDAFKINKLLEIINSIIISCQEILRKDFQVEIINLQLK